MLTKIIDIRDTMSAVARYVRETSDNEQIVTLYGDEFEVAHTANDLAHMFPKGNGKRQSVVGMMAIISPDPSEKPLSPEQELQLIEDFKTEYKTGERCVSMTKHTKHDGTSHYHLLVPDRDGRGRRLDINKNYNRNEKLSRKWEVAFGHEIQKGRHNQSVISHLEISGNSDIAEQLEAAEIHKGELPKEAFTKGVQGKAKRLGVDLSSLHRTLITAKEIESVEQKLSFYKQEMEQQGLQLILGKKDGVLLINKGDENLGSLSRIAKLDKDLSNKLWELETNVTESIKEDRASIERRRAIDEQPEKVEQQSHEEHKSESRRNTRGTNTERRRRSPRPTSGDNRVIAAVDDSRNQKRPKRQGVSSGSKSPVRAAARTRQRIELSQNHKDKIKRNFNIRRIAKHIRNWFSRNTKSAEFIRNAIRRNNYWQEQSEQAFDDLNKATSKGMAQLAKGQIHFTENEKTTLQDLHDLRGKGETITQTIERLKHEKEMKKHNEEAQRLEAERRRQEEIAQARQRQLEAQQQLEAQLYTPKFGR